jgi:trk system potassium uptake protein
VSSPRRRLHPRTGLRRALSRWLSRTPPPAVLASGYGALIRLGILLPLLPPMAHQPLTLTDAPFTSTSAVTVTGLAVVDTELVLTFWGQLVVAVLIQGAAWD